MMGDRDIIEMKGERGDDGEIRYTSAPPRPPARRPGLVSQVLGIAAGVAIFLVLVFFFVYVVIPLVLILIAWATLKNVFRRR
jgi:hypothetical protein